jgi:predicted DsbA family dithiol-disulfide isomerase
MVGVEGPAGQVRKHHWKRRDAMIHIDIFSDTICPWCLIGKRRLEKALAQRPDLDVAIHWRAFQLNPQMPPEGMDRQTYLAMKFGGPENAQLVYERIRRAGAEDGIDFNFEGIRRTPNTIASHRLIRWAAGQDRETETVEALFQAYFFRGQDIGDIEVLVAAAGEAGMDPVEARAFLESEALEAELREEDRQARGLGIDGVPCFIFNGRHALAGAQPPKVLTQMLDLAQQELAAAPAE